MSDKSIHDHRGDDFRDHGLDKDLDLDDTLRELFAAQAPASEPTPEEIAAWIAGELDPTQEEQLMGRVADCPGALDRVLATRRELEKPQDSHPTEPLDAATHRAVDSVMAAISETPLQAPTEMGPSRLPWIAAAMLATAFTAYTWLGSSELRRQHQILEDRWQSAQQQVAAQTDQIHELTAQLEDARQALDQTPSPSPTEVGPGAQARAPSAVQSGHRAGVQVEIQIAELFASSRLRSGSSGTPSEVGAPGETEMRVDLSTSRPAVLILTPRDPVPRKVYGIAVVTQDRRSLWQGEATADEAGVVVISLPVGFADPGLAWLELADSLQGVERFGLRFVSKTHGESNP